MRRFLPRMERDMDLPSDPTKEGRLVLCIERRAARTMREPLEIAEDTVTNTTTSSPFTIPTVSPVYATIISAFPTPPIPASPPTPPAPQAPPTPVPLSTTSTIPPVYVTIISTTNTTIITNTSNTTITINTTNTTSTTNTSPFVHHLNNTSYLRYNRLFPPYTTNTTITTNTANTTITTNTIYDQVGGRGKDRARERVMGKGECRHSANVICLVNRAWEYHGMKGNQSCLPVFFLFFLEQVDGDGVV
ncbi:hypothetical protein E2C01_052407 [Portunus trituberculatus]|uniref:Uncharacterized protein n=1 Tax=Portunus trituberculatus TaxID=210409 RepID=A0A5B7GEG6_PORTR|nr:hypothetical protein [Portunus trituberculatus]